MVMKTNRFAESLFFGAIKFQRAVVLLVSLAFYHFSVFSICTTLVKHFGISIQHALFFRKTPPKEIRLR